MRGGGDRRPDLENVELEGSEVSNVGCEMLIRDTIGRDGVGKGGEDVSWLSFVGSIVVSALDSGRNCSMYRLTNLRWFHSKTARMDKQFERRI